MHALLRCSALSVLRIALASLVMSLSLSALANDIIYTWTDDDGVRHFSAQPPEGREYRIVETLNPAVSEAREVASPPRDSLPPAALTEVSQAEPDPELVRERCEQARMNLDLLRQDRPAMLRQEDGEPVPMDDAARGQMIEETEAFITEWC